MTPTFTLDQIRAAARHGDAIVEEIGLPRFIESLGLSTQDLLHVAQQRAMRSVLPMTRGEEAAKAIFQPQGPMEYGARIDLSTAERQMVIIAQAAWLDGFVARHQAEGKEDETPAGACGRCRKPVPVGADVCPHCGWHT